MGRAVIISLCDLTGKFVEPWVAAGYDAVLVDPQHPVGVTVEARPSGAQVTRIGCTIIDAMGELSPIIQSGRVVYVAGWPPCTDVSLSGTRWWAAKRSADPYFQAKAAIVAEQCRVIGMACGCPWHFENPASAFSRIFGPPSHKFQPWHFSGLCANDNYKKETWLWTGGGIHHAGASDRRNAGSARRPNPQGATGSRSREFQERHAARFFCRSIQRKRAAPARQQ